MNKKLTTTTTKALAVVAVVALAAGVGYVTKLASFDGDVTGCLVESKDRTNRVVDGQSQGSDARVYTSCGVFVVEDNVFLGQWNSADVYGRLVEGRSYDLTAHGVRSGLLSLFPNITAATEVSR